MNPKNKDLIVLYLLIPVLQLDMALSHKKVPFTHETPNYFIVSFTLNTTFFDLLY